MTPRGFSIIASLIESTIVPVLVKESSGIDPRLNFVPKG